MCFTPVLFSTIDSYSYFQTLFLSVCFCTSIYIHESFSVAHQWTMLPPFWWKRYWITRCQNLWRSSLLLSFNMKIYGPAVRLSLSSPLVWHVMAFTARNYRRNWALPSAKGNEPMLKGSEDVTLCSAQWPDGRSWTLACCERHTLALWCLTDVRFCVGPVERCHVIELFW